MHSYQTKRQGASSRPKIHLPKRQQMICAESRPEIKSPSKAQKRKPETFDKSKPPSRDLIGQVFDRLTVTKWLGKANTVKDPEKKPRPVDYWECWCSCKNPEFNPVITSSKSLIGKKRRSCGCKVRKHNLSKTRVYRIWKSMLQRCENPKNNDYKNYGGRGISVCAKWHDFLNFYSDMGEPPTENHTIERIDNNQGYNPSNC